MSTERLFFGGMATLVVMVTLLPVVLLFGGSVMRGGSIDFTAYRMLLADDAMLRSLGNSLRLALTVALSTTTAGALLGVLLGKSDLRGGAVLSLLFTLPLLIPPYILAFGWSQLFSERFFGFLGLWFVLFTIYLPLPMLLTRFAMRRIDPALEEAALLTTGWGGVLRHITLPLIAPALLFSFLLVFVLSFGEYGVANFLRYPLFATQSFIYFSAFYDAHAAVAASAPILPVVVIVVMMERLIHHSTDRYGAGEEVVRFALGGWHKFAAGSLFVFAGIFALVPVGVLLYRSADAGIFMTALHESAAPLGRSLLYAASGATLLIFFGFVAAWIVSRRLFGWWRWLDGGVLLLFALPASLYGIALILFWNHPWSNIVYATPLIILLGYLGKYLALTQKITETRLREIPESYLEAASLSGARWYQQLRYIILPLSRESLLLAWVVGFLFSLRDDTLALLLHPPGADTISVHIATRMANGDPALIAATALLMVLATLLPIVSILFYLRYKKGFV